MQQKVSNLRGRVTQHRRSSGVRASCRRYDWNDVRVEVLRPINQSIGSRIRNQHVEATAPEGKICIRELRSVRPIIPSVIGVQIVVGVQQVVAHTAEHPVVHSAANDPVICFVTENVVHAVVNFVAIRIGGIKVQDKITNFLQRINSIVFCKLSCGRDVVQHRGVRQRSCDKPRGRCLCSGNPIIPSTAVNEVIAESAVDDVVSADIICRQIDTFLQATIDVCPSTDQGTG